MTERFQVELGANECVCLRVCGRVCVFRVSTINQHLSDFVLARPVRHGKFSLRLNTLMFSSYKE